MLSSASSCFLYSATGATEGPPRGSGPVNAKILLVYLREYPTHHLCHLGHTPVDFIVFFSCSACPVNLKLISYNK